MTWNRISRHLGLALLAGLAWSALPARSDAGTMDKALLANSGDVLTYLKDKKIRNVGVLPFRVKLGNRDALFAGGPIGTNLPRRIENALIMTMDDGDERQAVGIIRDATAKASKSRVGPYNLKKASFDKLFDVDYDLAWGGKTVKADAFLTGEVHNTGSNRGTTKVILNLFTKSNWDDSKKIVPAKTWTFNVRTDTMLAADLGYNFQLPTSLVTKRGVTALRRDQNVVQQITRADEEGETTQKPNQTQQPSPVNIQGFGYELHYNGSRQTLTPVSGTQQGSKAAVYTAPAMEPGSSISMFLTRTNAEAGKVGLVLMVNGQSTLDMETGDPVSCRKWIYDVDRLTREEWKGFYTTKEDGTLDCQNFKVLTAEESKEKASALGEKAGFIDLYVIGSNPTPTQEPEMLISTKGMPQARSKKMGLKELRAKLMKANHVKTRESLVARRAGGLLLHEMEAVPGGNYTKDQLPNPVILGHLQIRYYEP